MGRRFLAAGIAVAAMAAAAVVTSAQPTSALYDGAEDVSGNFFGDERDEVFSYVVGETPDFLLSFSNGGVPGGELTWEAYEFRVTGAYDPVAGNFDGDPLDEIFWYSSGGADSLWNFTSWTTRTSRPYTVGGDYDPVAGDFNGDGIDDIFWYGRGIGPDYIWYFNADGSYQSLGYRVDGTYTPIAGSFGSDQTDDVAWYRPGDPADYAWDFHPDKTYTSSEFRVTGRYEPFALDIFNEGWRYEDIFWYAPGAPEDSIWNFSPTCGPRGFCILPERVVGDYDTTAGDYLGDGHDDILWVGADGFSIWDHSPTPEGVVRYIYDFRAAAAESGSGASDATGVTHAGEAAGVTVPATPEGAVESGNG